VRNGYSRIINTDVEPCIRSLGKDSSADLQLVAPR
jgi:hypothetical protein